MKKLSLFLAIAIMFVAVFPLNVFAVKVGDEIGDVLNTDIKTYINGQRIPSYNINNKSAVFIKDLANYGFDTVFSEKNRTTTISYNTNKKPTPLKSFDETTGKVGTVAFRYVYTDIVAIINGRSVECFNVKGYNAIYFSELEDFGTFAWDNAKRESKFIFNNTTIPVTQSQTQAPTEPPTQVNLQFPNISKVTRYHSNGSLWAVHEITSLKITDIEPEPHEVRTLGGSHYQVYIATYELEGKLTYGSSNKENLTLSVEFYDKDGFYITQEDIYVIGVKVGESYKKRTTFYLPIETFSFKVKEDTVLGDGYVE